jgi:hypothetical protein
MNMIGKVVYLRDEHGYATEKRGRIMSVNHSNNMIGVLWDNGRTQLIVVTSLISEEQVQKEQNEQRLKEMHMKIEQCTVGAVVYRASTHAPLTRGKIAGPPQNNLAIVEWDGGTLTKVDINHLLTEADGLAENKRLTAENKRLTDEKDRLEREFKKVQDECKSKMEQAATLIKEAAKLAQSHGQDIQDMYEVTRGFEHAMDEAGWRTSSWHC